MATWPSTLPITRDSFKESPPNRVIRSNMDVGPDKVRRRSSNAPRPVSLSLFLTSAQLATFDTFYLENDAYSFTFTHPRTGLVVSARFTSEPDYSVEETMWRVSVEMEILP
jgi:hypothetical protein